MVHYFGLPNEKLDETQRRLRRDFYYTTHNILARLVALRRPGRGKHHKQGEVYRCAGRDPQP